MEKVVFRQVTRWKNLEKVKKMDAIEEAKKQSLEGLEDELSTY